MTRAPLGEAPLHPGSAPRTDSMRKAGELGVFKDAETRDRIFHLNPFPVADGDSKTPTADRDQVFSSADCRIEKEHLLPILFGDCTDREGDPSVDRMGNSHCEEPADSR